MKTAQLVAPLFLAVIAITPIFAQEGEFSGKVMHVKDGDSIVVMHGDKEEEIRLNGIDCPEKNQPFGSEATQKTTELCSDKTVSVKTHGLDQYHRTIGDVFLPDGKELNYELVRTGYAWWYRKYAPGNKELESLEQSARDQHLGLWAERLPVAPWMWRHGVRNLPNNQLNSSE